VVATAPADLARAVEIGVGRLDASRDDVAQQRSVKTRPQLDSISVPATRSVIALAASVARTSRAKVGVAERDRVTEPARATWRTSASAGRFAACLSQ
jgi:hypothetical protein